MEVIHESVAGLDVHKESVVGCVRIADAGRVRRECRTFGTTTEELQALLAWLQACQCSQVAMEATGVFWMPIWKVLSDGDFALIVANAAHIKAVPGRKTDMNDATWLADLAAFGLIRASFVPEEDVQELRTLMRTRKQVVREQTRHAQRIQKTLTEANIKLDSVVCDIMGVSGQRMIRAMIEGVRNPAKLAALAHRGVKASAKQLYDALHGRLTDHHRFLLGLHLGQWESLEAALGTIDQEVAERLARLDAEVRPGEATFSGLIRLLATIPGVSTLAARTILSEIGRDMSRFPTAGHLVAWAGMCPGQNESAGRRRPSRLRKGAPWLKTMLVQCAWAAKRKKDSYYQAQFLRLRSRRGPQKAICAVAASILTAIYHMLRTGTVHHDLGAGHFEKRAVADKLKHHVQKIAKLGYEVILQPVARAA